MRELIRRFPFTAFVLIAFGFTWPLAAGMRFSLLLPLLGLFGPLLGALVVVVALHGKEGLNRLWSRFAVQGRHVKWLAAALGLPLFLLIPMWLVERYAGFRTPLALGPITAISLALAFLVVGEEVGWRGFALPHLLERWPALVSGIGVGVVWALWHLPNFFLPGFPHQGLPFAAFLVLVVAYSILFTWLHLRTGGNLSVAVVFHAALNLFSLAGVDPVRQYWWKAMVYGIAAVLVAAAGGLRKSVSAGLR
jgi:uncharacterized protein